MRQAIENKAMAATIPGYTDGREVDEISRVEGTFLKDLMALWQSRLNGRRMPSRADFDAIELMKFGGRIALIDVEHDPRRYRFRLIGSYITAVLGRDSTGWYVDELYDRSFYTLAVEPYERALRLLEPITSHGNMKRMDKEFLRFSSLDLPLSDDGETVNMIMKGTEFELLR